MGSHVGELWLGANPRWTGRPHCWRGAGVYSGLRSGPAYIYMGLALQTIATKTMTANAWLAWVPIANLVLMLNVAMAVLLFLIPVVADLDQASTQKLVKSPTGGAF